MIELAEPPINPAHRDFFQEFLEIYSPSFAEREVAQFLAEKMLEFGFRRAYVDEAGNAIGELGVSAETATTTLLFLGHIDTVPGYIPVEILPDGDTIYGRGSVDAKGPFASFVLGAAALVQHQAEWAASGKRLILVGAVEEEAASSKGARFAATQYHPDFCVIGEPSGWKDLTIAYKGRLLIDYELSRDTKHTAADGPSACEEAVDFWNAVKNYANQFNEGKKVTDSLQPSLRGFGSDANGFQEVAKMRLGLRLPLNFPLDDFKAHLTKWAGDAKLELSGQETAVRSDKNNPLVRAFLSAIRAEGVPPGFKSKTGTSDMNVLAPLWGCPILAYGPGDSSLDHTPHEHASLSELERGVRVVQRVILTLFA